MFQAQLSGNEVSELITQVLESLEESSPLSQENNMLRKPVSDPFRIRASSGVSQVFSDTIRQQATHCLCIMTLQIVQDFAKTTLPHSGMNGIDRYPTVAKVQKSLGKKRKQRKQPDMKC